MIVKIKPGTLVAVNYGMALWPEKNKDLEFFTKTNNHGGLVLTPVDGSENIVFTNNSNGIEVINGKERITI